MIKGIIFDWIGTLYERDTSLFPETEEVLTELEKRGYKMSLVSKASEEFLKRGEEIRKSGIRKYLCFDILCREKTQDDFKRCMAAMRTTPEATYAVDDRTLRGIKIGNELGCKTIWIRKGEYSKETPNKETGEPTHTIPNLIKLLDILT